MIIEKEATNGTAVETTISPVEQGRAVDFSCVQPHLA